MKQKTYTIDPKELSEDVWLDLVLHSHLAPSRMWDHNLAKSLKRSRPQVEGALSDLDEATRGIKNQLINLQKLKAYLTALIEEPKPKELA